MEQTIAVLEHRNVIGVLSGTLRRVQRWREAAPDRFIPGFQFQLGREQLSPDSLGRLYKAGRFAVLVMHAGWPMLDDLLAVLWVHPQVYIDLGGIVFGLPRPELYRYLQRIVDAGFGKRVMFGSDQMVWPGVIERAIQAIEFAPFLSESQKRDILYNNAARFLRLSNADIARHHGH
jgi:predicted TIM-barrel fold metal-dependent hydrolase